jgi:hypothetical protein
MPSPFPGMDPYLEEPGLWPDVHHGLISQIQAVLTGLLRPKYYLRVEERVYVSDQDDPGRKVIIPDVRIADNPNWQGGQLPATAGGGLTVAEPIEVTSLIDDEIHEAQLEVIDRAQRQVITVIEIASPTNKVAGSQGRASYIRKRQEVMNSPSHLVEIDLLRAGDPLNFRELLPPHDYLVHVSIQQRRPGARVWPIRLRQRLPVVPIPLRPEDPPAPLDLQQILVAVYDRAGYDMSINYRDEPTPPLHGENAEWAANLLREKGLRE